MLAKVMRFVIALIGFAIGYSLFSHFQVLPVAVTIGAYDLSTVIGAFLFGLICFLFAPALASALGRLGHWLERTLLMVPGQDMVAGTIGIIIGLLIGTLLVQPFRGVIPILGDYLPIITNLLLAWVGMMVAVKKREDILSIFACPALRGTAPAGRDGGGKILDTSVIIDGRIADICDAGFIDGKLIIRVSCWKNSGILPIPLIPSNAIAGAGLDILNRIQRKAAFPCRSSTTMRTRVWRWTPAW